MTKRCGFVLFFTCALKQTIGMPRRILLWRALQVKHRQEKPSLQHKQSFMNNHSAKRRVTKRQADIGI